MTFERAPEDSPPGAPTPAPYDRVTQLVAEDRCVILDGATGAALIEHPSGRAQTDEHLWGLRSVIDAPEDIAALHRRYADAGCDVLSTTTWGLPTALRDGAQGTWAESRSVHWMDVARGAVRLARAAARDSGRPEIAVGFSLNGDVDTPDNEETIRLLHRAFETDPPDFLLVETLSLVRTTTYATVARLLETGLPVWLSFRRCRQGVCGIYGEHWGGPEGDAFGRAAGRLEQLGVGALMVNCIPPDHVAGMTSWLRDFTDLPLGVYPNLGYLSNAGWRNETRVGPQEFAELALAWREEGAQLVGGCCGVGPEHIARASAALAGTPAGHRRVDPLVDELDTAGGAGDEAPPAAWTDRRGRALHPLELPDLQLDAGVPGPTDASFLLWKYLFSEGVGAHQRCLDVGCGAGLLTIQLARNGAAHVHGLDLEPAAVAATLTNAFRNGVADRVTAATSDLFPWVPEERYDLIVADLQQLPADPFDQVATHRPMDYWGRSLTDHVIGLLPEALAPDGVAYVLQLSVTGARRTSDGLRRRGLRAQVVDFAVVGFDERFHQVAEQIRRVEQLSDAFHLQVGPREVAVAYLLEITRDDALRDG